MKRSSAVFGLGALITAALALSVFAAIALAWENDTKAEVTGTPVCNTETGEFAGDFVVSWSVSANADEGWTITKIDPSSPQVVNYPASEANTKQEFSFTLTESKRGSSDRTQVVKGEIRLDKLDKCEAPEYVICHATGNSDTFPADKYVQNPPAKAGVVNGHMGDSHQNGNDIIPPFVYGGQTLSQHWDAVGQGIFGNGCVAPEEEEDGGTLIVEKVVINDNGGTAEADDFSFRVNGRGPVAFESDGSNAFQVPAGYVATVVEVAAQGYTTTYSESNGGTVEKGGTLTIRVTNDDVKGEEPPPPPHEVKGDASVSCVLPDGSYRVSGTVDGQAADKVVPATIPGNFAGSTDVTVTRGDTSFRGTVTTDGKCGNVPTPPVVTPPAVVTPPTVTTPPVETTPTTVPTAPLTPPKASTKPAAPAKVKKATTAPTKPKVKVAGAVAGNPPKLAYTP